MNLRSIQLNYKPIALSSLSKLGQHIILVYLFPFVTSQQWKKKNVASVSLWKNFYMPENLLSLFAITGEFIEKLILDDSSFKLSKSLRPVFLSPMLVAIKAATG